MPAVRGAGHPTGRQLALTSRWRTVPTSDADLDTIAEVRRPRARRRPDLGRGWRPEGWEAASNADDPMEARRRPRRSAFCATGPGGGMFRSSASRAALPRSWPPGQRPMPVQGVLADATGLADRDACHAGRPPPIKRIAKCRSAGLLSSPKSSAVAGLHDEGWKPTDDADYRRWPDRSRHPQASRERRGWRWPGAAGSDPRPSAAGPMQMLAAVRRWQRYRAARCRPAQLRGGVPSGRDLRLGAKTFATKRCWARADRPSVAGLCPFSPTPPRPPVSLSRRRDVNRDSSTSARRLSPGTHRPSGPAYRRRAPMGRRRRRQVWSVGDDTAGSIRDIRTGILTSWAAQGSRSRLRLPGVPLDAVGPGLGQHVAGDGRENGGEGGLGEVLADQWCVGLTHLHVDRRHRPREARRWGLLRRGD
jgi:hypothetical protein